MDEDISRFLRKTCLPEVDSCNSKYTHKQYAVEEDKTQTTRSPLIEHDFGGDEKEGGLLEQHERKESRLSFVFYEIAKNFENRPQF